MCHWGHVDEGVVTLKLLSRRAVAAATFALLPLTALAVPGTAAADHCSPVGSAGCEDVHGPTVYSMTISRPVAVIYQTSATPVTLTMRVSDDGEMRTVLGLVSISGPRPAEYQVPMSRTAKDADGIETWTGTFTPPRTAPTGTYDVGAEVLDTAFNGPSKNLSGENPKLQVKRNTGLSVNASPEPVAKGAKLLVAGKLTRLTTQGSYVAYGGKRVDLYFRPVGGKYTYVGSQTTNRYGRFGGPVRATEDGTWAVRFNGTSNYVAKRRGDYVDVR